MTTRTKRRIIYAASDYLMSMLAMVVFNIARYHYFSVYPWGSLKNFLAVPTVVMGIFVIPAMMLVISYLSGYYYDMNARSRVDEFINTLATTFVGSLLIYFIVLVNDPVVERGAIYELVFVLWLILFIFMYPARLAITNLVVRGVHAEKTGFNTLIIGTSKAAHDMARRLGKMPKAMGYNVLGYVNTGVETSIANPDLPVYQLDEIDDLCRRLQVRNLIVAPRKEGLYATIETINRLFSTGCSIYVSPFLFQQISGKSHFGNVVGEPLIDITRPDVSPMTMSCKRAADVLLSGIAALLLIPVYAVLAIAVKCDSRGPVFYLQERVGLHKRRFRIIKFRTMSVDAEPDGPALSSADDPRVTRVGHFLRKYRLDELPQFFNVIKGDMSIVGPRPERPFFVDQIVKRVPYYSLIHTVRPGITSLGMVKYGYAADVDEMVERLKYDLIYIENVSMGLDLKIIFYTFNTVITGKGV